MDWEEIPPYDPDGQPYPSEEPPVTSLWSCWQYLSKYIGDALDKNISIHNRLLPLTSSVFEWLNGMIFFGFSAAWSAAGPAANFASSIHWSCKNGWFFLVFLSNIIAIASFMPRASQAPHALSLRGVVSFLLAVVFTVFNLLGSVAGQRDLIENFLNKDNLHQGLKFFIYKVLPIISQVSAIGSNIALYNQSMDYFRQLIANVKTWNGCVSIAKFPLTLLGLISAMLDVLIFQHDSGSGVLMCLLFITLQLATWARDLSMLSGNYEFNPKALSYYKGRLVAHIFVNLIFVATNTFMRVNLAGRDPLSLTVLKFLSAIPSICKRNLKACDHIEELYYKQLMKKAIGSYDKNLMKKAMVNWMDETQAKSRIATSQLSYGSWRQSGETPETPFLAGYAPDFGQGFSGLCMPNPG